MSGFAIRVEKLSKVYKNSTRAVDDISFTVRDGEFYGFLGPNGAGKTTTMRILATLLRPTSGAVQVAGFQLGKEDDAIRRSIGFAMQGVTLDSTASAWENLILIGALYGLSKKEAIACGTKLLNLLNLEKVADSWISQYSGGMKRRLDLAAVLMHHPKLLFLDEPTEGLDPAARRVIWNYLKEMKNDGTTIFLTTHYMEEADELCERISIIDHGKIIVTQPPEELKRAVKGTLEDAFIHYTGHGIRDESIDSKGADPYIQG
ncbi:ATP-binding cassette domain-containing protein [Candidatus Acetothermia bacterium]|nr:ATP-binding cassette domain-containing protein [Candidatus Acetothermia bacterium]MBI3643472.1 ATP-binding cassette domain-containing protein [Candidatus Acetothermia bacterium]